MSSTKPLVRVCTETHAAEITVPGSVAHQEALQLQSEMFGRAMRSGSKSYAQTVHSAPERTSLLVVYRQASDRPICTARLVRPPETLIEAVVQFVPGSLPARELAAERIIEMGGFVLHPDVERGEIPDILDTLALALLQLSDPHIAWFWALPRRHLMSLFRADIPDVLPPYHMALCHDVLGWHESSDCLRLLREADFKGHQFGLRGAPYLYTISRQTIAHDLTQRLAALHERRRHPAFVQVFNEAMRAAQGHIQRELDRVNGEGGHHSDRAH
jgi:hypothetical protein